MVWAIPKKLSDDFWRWRAQYQPFNTDDIPRIERADGRKRSWSAASVTQQKQELAQFDARWKALGSQKRPTAQQVDYRLLGSALARVHWELDVNRRWQRDPTFYVEQTMTAVLEMLLPPPPFDSTRAHELILRLQNIPSLLAEGEANLQHPAAPFARLAVDSLADIRGSLAVVRGRSLASSAGGSPTPNARNSDRRSKARPQAWSPIAHGCSSDFHP